MVAPLLNLTEVQALSALRSFLLTSVATGTEIFRGQVNRVPEPRNADFVVMTPLRMERLETNETTYRDYDVVGSIEGDILTVTEIGHGALEAGVTLRGTSGLIAVDTTVVSQLSGTVGGTGTYRVSISQSVGSGVIYAGLRDDLVAIQATVQLDIHGPQSTNNAVMIETLFRSEVGYDSFVAQGYAVVPLYCANSRQMPFINAEQAYEDRWVVEAVLQISPITSTPQEFADALEVPIIPADIYIEPTTGPYLLDDQGNYLVDDQGNLLLFQE